jgi:hypothetical protein
MCQENCYLVDPSDLFYSTWMKASVKQNRKNILRAGLNTGINKISDLFVSGALFSGAGRETTDRFQHPGPSWLERRRDNLPIEEEQKTASPADIVSASPSILSEIYVGAYVAGTQQE